MTSTSICVGLLYVLVLRQFWEIKYQPSYMESKMNLFVCFFNCKEFTISNPDFVLENIARIANAVQVTL